MIRTLTATILGVVIAMNVAAPLAKAEPPPTVIIIAGPPGSGKTTQAKFLSKKYKIPSFAMSDLLAMEMKSNRVLSKTFAAAIASGDMLPDDQATELIRKHLLSTDLHKGFVLDGYPGTAAQAKSLDNMLADLKLPKAVVIVLQAPDEVIRKRMLARKRADDTPDIINRRIREFRTEAALLEGWAGQTRVVRVDSTATISEVSNRIAVGVEESWSHMAFATRQ